jgi:putative hydrolase of the HAD superfamily
MRGTHRHEDLLLDLGNVLVGVDPARTVAAFSRLAGRDIGGADSSFDELLDLNARFDSGSIDAAGFRTAVRERLGTEISDEDFDSAWCALIVLLPQTAQLVAELSRGHRLFMLSNTDPIHLRAVRRRCADWLPRFSGLFLSYEERLTKPDPAFFERALARLDLDPATCLFLDDRAENVHAARAVGIEARQVTTTGLVRERLVEWGLLEA